MKAASPSMTKDLHAEVVAYITRDVPSLWAVLYAPLNYVFDECHVCETRQGRYAHPDCGLSLKLQMQDLRAAFDKAADWETLSRICRDLVELDKRAAANSIGIRRPNGTILYGQSIA